MASWDAIVPLGSQSEAELKEDGSFCDVRSLAQAPLLIPAIRVRVEVVASSVFFNKINLPPTYINRLTKF